VPANTVTRETARIVCNPPLRCHRNRQPGDVFCTQHGHRYHGIRSEQDIFLVREHKTLKSIHLVSRVDGHTIAVGYTGWGGRIHWAQVVEQDYAWTQVQITRLHSDATALTALEMLTNGDAAGDNHVLSLVRGTGHAGVLCHTDSAFCFCINHQFLDGIAAFRMLAVLFDGPESNHTDYPLAAELSLLLPILRLASHTPVHTRRLRYSQSGPAVCEWCSSRVDTSGLLSPSTACS